jgi:hypothetical protein
MAASAANRQAERDPEVQTSREYLLEKFPLSDPARLSVFRKQTRTWVGKAVKSLGLHSLEVDDPTRQGQRLVIIGYSDSVCKKKADEIASGDWNAREAI